MGELPEGGGGDGGVGRDALQVWSLVGDGEGKVFGAAVPGFAQQTAAGEGGVVAGEGGVGAKEGRNVLFFARGVERVAAENVR